MKHFKTCKREYLGMACLNDIQPITRIYHTKLISKR